MNIIATKEFDSVGVRHVIYFNLNAIVVQIVLVAQNLVNFLQDSLLLTILV